MTKVLAIALAATASLPHSPPAAGPTTLGAQAVAPARATAPARPALRAERERLRAAEAARSEAAAKRGMASGFTELLADDAIYLAPGAPVVRGLAAVRALVAAPPASRVTGMRWRPVRVDVSADARAGYTYGYAEWTSPDSAGKPTARFGKYISYWRKNAEDDWRVAAFVLAPGAGPAPTEPPPAGFESPDTDDAPRYPIESVDAGRLAVAGTDSAFAATALVKGIPAAFGEFAAPDGAVLSGGPSIVYGPVAIRGGRSGSVASDTLRWGPVIAEVAESGDLAFTVGEAHFTGTDPQGKRVDSYSKYLTVWRRQPAHVWRYVVDGGNARPKP
jgi:ketosteroid isomerase-like protein